MCCGHNCKEGKGRADHRRALALCAPCRKKCLNEKHRREQENVYLEELAELISASLSDMNSLSVKPDKCAILQETVNQIRRIKQQEQAAVAGAGGGLGELQQSEVSSSKPTILGSDVLGPLLLEALDGFLFVVNTEGRIEFVSENVASFLQYGQGELDGTSIYNILHHGDHGRFSSNLLPMSLGANGLGWAEAGGKSRTFQCRFLLRPPDAEEKQTRVSLYENMHISAIFLPYPNGAAAASAAQGDDSSSGATDSGACVRLGLSLARALCSLTRWLARPPTHSLVLSLTCSLARLPIHPSTRSLTHHTHWPACLFTTLAH